MHWDARFPVPGALFQALVILEPLDSSWRLSSIVMSSVKPPASTRPSWWVTSVSLQLLLRSVTPILQAWFPARPQASQGLGFKTSPQSQMFGVSSKPELSKCLLNEQMSFLCSRALCQVWGACTSPFGPCEPVDPTLSTPRILWPQLYEHKLLKNTELYKIRCIYNWQIRHTPSSQFSGLITFL